LKLERFREQIRSWLSYPIKRKKKKTFVTRETLAEREHLRLRGKYRKGIGCWFFETEQYQRWLDGDCSTLVCPGIPGSGKTMLASEAVDRLNDMSRNQNAKGPIGVAFAYLDAEPSDIDPALRLMKQLLRQLVENCPWSDVLRDTEAWIESTPSSLEAVTVLARKVGKLYHQVYIVIDALDELNSARSARKGANEAIASLQDLQVNFGAKLLFTLRNVPDVTGQLREDGRIDMKAKEKDISTIVDRELQDIDMRWSGEKLYSETLRHDLRNIMVSNSKNM
jgi:Cdc6-like AAA superfamily ATPase